VRFSKKLLFPNRTVEVAAHDTGCLEADAFDVELEAFAMSNAVPFEALHLRSEEDAPIIDFGSLDEFFEIRRKRSEIGKPKFSWQDGFYFYNQGSLGSCTGHAAAHAFMASNRHIRLHNGNTFDKNINPIGAWFKSKGWSARGGQSVARMAAEVNEFGNTPSSRIGSDNLKPNKSAILAAAPEASRNQSGICFFKPTAENIIKFARSGIGTFIGNRLRVAGTDTNKDGLRIPKFSGTWAHATAFTDYVKIGTKEYVGWLNSWGAIYKTPDRLNLPAWMCWMDRDHLDKFLASASSYGNGCAVFAE